MADLPVFRGEEARPNKDALLAMLTVLVQEEYHKYGDQVRYAAREYILRADWTFKRPKQLVVADFFVGLRRDVGHTKGESAEHAYQRGVLYGEQQAAKRNYDAAYNRGLSDGLKMRPPDVQKASDEARLAMLAVLRTDMEKDGVIEELRKRLRLAERTIRRLEREKINQPNEEETA